MSDVNTAITEPPDETPAPVADTDPATDTSEAEEPTSDDEDDAA